MDEEKSGKGFGALENLSIRILVLGAADREEESTAMKLSMSPRHEVSSFVPAKPNILTKLSAARAVTQISPHVIHALGLTGAAASAMSIANGTNTDLIISLSTADIEKTSPRKLIRASKQAAAMVVETEAEADKLRAAGIKRDIYVTASPHVDDEDSQRFFLGAIEIVYGRIINPSKLPEPTLDTDGAPLVRIGGISKGGAA